MHESVRLGHSDGEHRVSSFDRDPRGVTPGDTAQM